MLATCFCTHVDIFCFIFFSVKMYFQMLSHLVTLANKGVKTISYWNCNYPCGHWSPVPAYLEGSEFPRKQIEKSLHKSLQYFFSCQTFRPSQNNRNYRGHDMTPTQTNACKCTIFWREILQNTFEVVDCPQMGNWMIPQYPDLSSRFA